MSKGRVLGLDVGTRRIGVAISDPDRLVATTLTTLHITKMHEGVSQVTELVQTNAITTVVIGMPYLMAGQEGEQAQITRLFGSALAEAVSVPLVYVDERMTSSMSDSTMRQLSISPRRHKGHRDQLAALFILQLYLDQQAHSPF